MAADKKSFQWNKETIIIMGLMCVVFFWTLNRIQPEPGPQEEKIEKPKNEATQVVDKAMVPLATGKEPIDKIFVQSGCAACHMIPGIRVAKGREGPKLELGTNARRRLADPNYRGESQNRVGIRAGIHSESRRLYCPRVSRPRHAAVVRPKTHRRRPGQDHYLSPEDRRSAVTRSPCRVKARDMPDAAPRLLCSCSCGILCRQEKPSGRKRHEMARLQTQKNRRVE